jgi:hypothetical protein
MSKPPCADWILWIGKEIEGHTDIGKWTMFARGGNVLNELARCDKPIQRVWLCKEYLHGHAIPQILDLLSRCLDRNLHTAIEVPMAEVEEYRLLYNWAVPYIKWNIELPVGAHICVGEPFHDELFLIGEGKRMTPAPYMDDIRIL